MPASKKRTKPTRPQDTRTPRARFLALAARRGTDFTGPVRFEPTGPALECWTNAWVAAATTGGTYCEGTCQMPNGAHAHAWVLGSDGHVLKVTQGYQDATGYRGFAPDERRVAATTADWDGPRSSVLEAGLAAAVPTEDVLAAMTRPVSAPAARP